MLVCILLYMYMYLLNEAKQRKPGAALSSK